jgi:dTDP-alpha-D-glucose dehydrogenase
MAHVGVVGFGHIGSTLGAVLSAKGHHVVGFDREVELIHDFEIGRCPIPEPGVSQILEEQVAAGRLTFSTEFAAISDVDIIIITVGTPLTEDYTADLSHISAACESMEDYVRDGQLVIVKSTVPPGTTRNVVANILARRTEIKLAFSPERLAQGQAIQDLLTLPVIVGGIDNTSRESAVNFWRSSLGVEVFELSSLEAAELVKLADNVWIDLNVALANELAKLCDVLPYHLDVLEVIKAANSLKKGQHYVNILTPSNGVGGYCLTKDPWILRATGKDYGLELDIPRVSRTINDSMPGYVARQIARHFSKMGVPPNAAKVAIMGLAFKSNSGDLRRTPVYPFLRAMKEAGFVNFAIHDPMAIDKDVQRMQLSLIRDWREALHGAHCAAFFVGHNDFKSIGTDDLASLLTPGALVFDGRMYFTRPAIEQMTAAGLVYQGVGR